MKTYEVIYSEVIHHKFYVDANNASEIDMDMMCKMAANGELDFSYGEVMESDIVSVKEYDEEVM